MKDNTISNNEAEQGGGAFIGGNEDSPDFDRNDFVVNEAEQGGIYLQDQIGEISIMTLLSNEADNGGGLYIENGSNIVHNATYRQ